MRVAFSPKFPTSNENCCYISLQFTEKNQSGEDVLFVDKFSSISVSKAKVRKTKNKKQKTRVN